MAKSAQTESRLALDEIRETYDEIREDNSKFEADISPTNLKGVKHLTLAVDRPFRSPDELARWLHACVSTLQSNLNEHKELPWDD